MKPTVAQYKTLFSRHASNPILTGKVWPYCVNTVFNAGATLLLDGSTLLLYRVEDRRGLSHLCAARSVNGIDGWQIDREPTLVPTFPPAKLLRFILTTSLPAANISNVQK